MNRIVDIMALMQALYNTAKRYHWIYSGVNFYEWHLFFDRIADTIEVDSIDDLAEKYYMRLPTESRTDLNEFDTIVKDSVGPATADVMQMVNSLRNINDSLIMLVKNVTPTVEQGLKSELDTIASNCETISALLNSANDPVKLSALPGLVALESKSIDVKSFNSLKEDWGNYSEDTCWDEYSILENHDAVDLCDMLNSREGSAVADQLESILTGDALYHQNPNALEIISGFAREKNETHLANAIDAYLKAHRENPTESDDTLINFIR